jgi:RNA recognition motif-containing protein
VGLHPGGIFVGKRLFVGNLPHQISRADLNQLFSEFGTVLSVEIMQGRGAGSRRGFGFVEMDNEADAQAAIQGLHNREIDGRRFTVDEARPRKYRGFGVGGGGLGGFGGGGVGSGGSPGRRW